jgi:hypothetical protein
VCVYTTDQKEKWVEWRIQSKVDFRGENMMLMDPKTVFVIPYEYLPSYDFLNLKIFLD